MWRFSLVFLVCLFFLLNNSCKKESDSPSGSNKIDIGTTTIDSISYFSAQISTALICTGGNQITQHGHCWSTTENPTTEDNKTNLGSISSPKTFSSELLSLDPNTVYYIRAYVTFDNGSVYGQQEQIKTLKTGVPLVQTGTFIAPDLTWATGEGLAIADSGLTIIQKGFCWSQNPNPSLLNNIDYSEKGGGLGSFTDTITGLEEGNQYYVVAYATNDKGTSYGEIKTFQTVPITIPTVITSEVTSITINSASCGGEVIDAGNGTVIVRGVCWSTQPSPTLENNSGYTTNGSGIGSFSSSLTGLIDETTYYVTAYATNEKGTSYGEVKTFSTLILELPVVSTSEVTNITSSSAICGGNVTSNGNGTVSVRGVCWNTSENPTLENNIGFTTEGQGAGVFSSNLTGLTDGTTYHVTAYATNEKGSSYGEVQIFQTILVTLPQVVTSEITGITINSAEAGGEVTNAGNGTISARGVCWDTQLNPTLENNIGYTIDGNGTGVFLSLITGLTDGIVYYVTAYATNEKGTSYGEVILFETLESCGIVNYGGEIYSTIVIGSQCWLGRNLNIGERINGSQEPQNNGIIEKYCYDDNETICDEYGGMYQWDEMMQYSTLQGSQGICPDGWHIPTDNEWKILEGTVDSQHPVGDPVWENTGYRGYDGGKNLKSSNGWNENGNGTDAYGFKAIPSGCLIPSKGDFVDLGASTLFWTSTHSNISEAWDRVFRFNFSGIGRWAPSYLGYGLSVRCLKN